LNLKIDRIKIAKKLLKLGADKNIEDNKSRKPVDISLQKKYKTMEDLLNNESILSMGISSSYNINQANKKNLYPFIIFIFFFIKEFFTIFTISFYIDSIKLILLSLLTLLILSIMIIILTFNFPYKQKNNSENFNFLLNKVLDNQSLRRICPYCKENKTDFTVHCYYCGICIENYDHHCIWLANCIGKNNIFTFRVFLTCILFKILVNEIISFKSKIKIKSK
jgi:hypothetical protein